MTDNVTPIRPGARERSRADDLNTADIALNRAIAMVDLLQGAAARGAIDSGESLAQTLGVVHDLLEETREAIWPPALEAHSEDQP